MDRETRKIFDRLYERIKASATSKESEERKMVDDLLDDMPRMMEAFDAWCDTQEVEMPVQAALCAYIIGRNLSTIGSKRSRTVILEALFVIVLEGMCVND